LCFERRLVESLVAEGGEGRIATLHARDEALLAHDEVHDIAELGSPSEVQRHLRLAPHCIERIVPGKQICDGLVHAVASESQIASLSGGASSRPTEFDHARERLRPEGG